MRSHEFIKIYEATEPTGPKAVTKAEITDILQKNGYTDLKIDGNKIRVLAQIPSGQKKSQYRMILLNDILKTLETQMPEAGAEYSNDRNLSSLGGIVFVNSPLQITVKDVGVQGDQSAGVANELQLVALLQSVIDKYKSVNVTFVDPRGKKVSIKNCTRVDASGRDTAGRKKADVELYSATGSLPISIKKLNADMWESADNLFGARARKILDKLVKDGVVELRPIGEKKLKKGSVTVYELSKEIVMEPTQEEAIQAIFGSDLNPTGGVVIQTFKPEHFKQVDNNVTVEAHAVITNISEIPETHMMVWLLRNDSTRNGGTIGIAGIRPLGVTLMRGIGKHGTKDVILVDKNGNVVERKK